MNSRRKVLIVEDEEKILNLIQDVLIEKYDVVTAQNGEDAIVMAQDEQPDVILLDKIIPKMDGILTSQYLRRGSKTKHIPIIMLTALKEPEDRTAAFAAGIDDFISKPFHPDELIARVEAKIVRFQSLQNKSVIQEIVVGNLRFNMNDRSVFINDKMIHLTSLEFQILQRLLQNRGEVQSRAALISSIWGDSAKDDRVLDSHFASLRRKLKNFSEKIVTVYGEGYVIRDNATGAL
jgi:DNA-binding response OmpR family regulator